MDQKSFQEREFRIALALCPFLEPSTLRKLMIAFGSAKNIWEADVESWRACIRMHTNTIQRLHQWRSWNRDLACYERNLLTRQVGIIVMGDESYPAAFYQLADPPVVLFTMGDASLLHQMNVSIIGTRRASGYGLEATRWIAEIINQEGISIVSGLAMGIDGAAHQAALHRFGKTIAVLGSGIDVCYPPSHHLLYHQIIEMGLVISEYAPGVSAAKYHFPERNRLIAALGAITIVVQAGERSGSLRTVDYALELGKDVYVVPGPITSIHFRGSHRLLQEGARLLLDPIDVLKDLGLKANLDSIHSVVQIPARWAELYQAISELTHPTQLALDLQLPLSHVHAGLLELELSGYVVRARDGTYQKQQKRC